jgi:hypothetical protein
MRDPISPQPQQRTLPFVQVDLRDQLPEADRCRCQELCSQLLRAVVESEELSRRSYEREDQS